jgi:Leucine-rich repeat (LRR) protein
MRPQNFLLLAVLIIVGWFSLGFKSILDDEFGKGVKKVKKDSIYYSVESALLNIDRAKVLILRKKKLTFIPPEVFLLTNLTRLDLSGNKIRLIPDSINQLINLDTLDISGNRLIKISPEIKALTKLKFLDLGKNELDSVPETIGSLKKLEKLDLWDNNISYIPDQISSLDSNLKVLDLRGILFNAKKQARIDSLLPRTKIHMSPPCNCQ